MDRADVPTDPAASKAPELRKDFRNGLAGALAAFLIWGLMPLYLRPLAHVSPAQIMANRIVWCFLLLFGWLIWRGDMAAVRTALRDRPVRLLLATSSVLISINWLTYLWAVANGHVLDASLGYFINPLLNVLLGVMLLRERLNRAQWVSVTLAAFGVVYMTLATGRLPWIALVLAASFGMYALIRKLVKVEAVPGLGIETLMLVPFAVAYLVWAEARGVGALGHATGSVNLLLIGSGLITAVPLALFAFGARRLPLSTVGLVQYVGPTIQFLIGIFVFHESFTQTRAIGFACIWVALAIYMADGWRRNRGAALTPS